METKVLDLTDHSSDQISLLAGQNRGQAVRKSANLDRFDRQDDAVMVLRVPAYITDVLPSFMLGLFTDSLRVLGEAKFVTKYVGEGPLAQAAILEFLRVSRLMGRRVMGSGT